MPAEAPKVYRVAELSRKVSATLDRWGEVWVEGEISDLKRARSGHVYLTLDDGDAPAQLGAIIFRGDTRFVRAKLDVGERVRALGRFSLYEPRGTLRLIVRSVLAAGEGDKRAALERLKAKLRAEGLFAPERKRALPRLPRAIGLVTSRDGAALHDVLRVAMARAPLRVVLAHAQVQGAEAPASIARAIARVGAVAGVEVVILTRGGGAREDLSAFDAEPVVRAIVVCPVPVVSGVGHEVDQTLADLAADVRAATPSNAAEIVVPERDALEAELEAWRRRLERACERRHGEARLRLERSTRGLEDPRRALGKAAARVRDLETRLTSALRRRLFEAERRQGALAARLGAADPRARLARDRARFEALGARLMRVGRAELVRPRREALARAEARLYAEAISRAMSRDRQRHATLSSRLVAWPTPAIHAASEQLRARVGRLHALSPLAVLSRGYAIALHGEPRRALVDAAEANVGDGIELRLARGRLSVSVRARLDEEAS